MCKEFTEGFAMNQMQGMQNITEKSKRNLDEVFFNKEGEQICKRQMQELRETLENFIQNWSVTKSPMLEYID